MDDHARFSSHMSQSSWLMGGGRMIVAVDESQGQKIGSHIRLSGKVLGIKLFLDEVVTHYDQPHLKVWETIGDLKLLVIGHYRMGIELKPQPAGSLLRVFIDYDWPKNNAWLGRLFGGVYAKWCVNQMLKGVNGHFTSPKTSLRAVYTCPMHPEIKQDQAGLCPKCGMELVPVENKKLD